MPQSHDEPPRKELDTLDLSDLERNAPHRASIPPDRPTVGVLGTARFKAGAELGTGGMGVVVEYFDVYLGRHVAMKMLRTDRPENGTASILEREARITGRLEHPNIIPVYDAGRDPRFGPFYIMRVVKEPTLHTLLGRLRQNEPDALAEYTQGRLLRIFLQVCNAIEYAHQHGVIHCDLKPANIMLGTFGEVLVADWGFACEVQHGTRLRGGTPGYMSPEQVDSRPGRIDRRADVFALGCILYELLTFQRAFPIVDVDDMLSRIARNLQPLPRPAPFRRAAPGRILPPELEEICTTALQFDPDQRYPTVLDMSTAVEAFLEGTKERELRTARAAAAFEQGTSLAESYDELVLSNRVRHRELALLRASVAPWETSDAKQALWDAEDQYAIMDSIRIRTFQGAVAAYEAVLDEVPGHPEARLGLAKLYWSALRRAEERRDTFDRVYFESRVNEYDDSANTELGPAHKSVGMLVVDVEGEGEIWLERHAEQGRRMVPVEATHVASAPLVYPTLDSGAYVVRVELGNGQVVRCPVLVRTGEKLHVELDLDEASQARADEVLIPGGAALLGGHETSALGPELTLLEVPSFFIARRPVTLGEYIEFVEYVATHQPADFDRLVPRRNDRRPYGTIEAGRFVLATPEPQNYVPAWRELPALGIDARAALAYAAWRSARDGVTYRLPTELEWEKAARGTDGRAYPWGDRFDAAFCKMRDARREAPLPEPVGAFPTDVSPYGVLDLAGGVADWVSTAHERLVVSRGGAWSDWSADCHLGARRTYTPEESSSRVGFRLARDVPPRVAKTSDDWQFRGTPRIVVT